MKHILKNELTFTYLNVKETHQKKFSIYEALDTFSWQSREFQDIKKPSGICLFVMFWRILGCRRFIKEMKMACIFHYCFRQWVFTASLSQGIKITNKKLCYYSVAYYIYIYIEVSSPPHHPKRREQIMLGEEGENENSIICISSATIYVACVECQKNIHKKQVFHFRSQNIMARIFYFIVVIS